MTAEEQRIRDKLEELSEMTIREIAEEIIMYEEDDHEQAKEMIRLETVIVEMDKKIKELTR